MSVRISFAGGFAIHVDDKLIDVPLRGRTREMLAYLLLHANREIRREKLADLFWPNRCDASSRNLLSTSLWRIRKALSVISGIELCAGTGTVRISTSIDVVSEAELLVEAVRRFNPSSTTGKVCEQLLLSIGTEDGEFLEGLSSDWAQVERERYTSLRVDALTMLMTNSADVGNFEDAIVYSNRILAIDPLRENILRQLMWLYVQVGRPGHALRQFEKFRTLLRVELSLNPMPETLALCLHIQDESNTLPLRQAIEDASTRRRIVYDTLSSRKL